MPASGSSGRLLRAAGAGLVRAGGRASGSSSPSALLAQQEQQLGVGLGLQQLDNAVRASLPSPASSSGAPPMPLPLRAGRALVGFGPSGSGGLAGSFSAQLRLAPGAAFQRQQQGISTSASSLMRAGFPRRDALSDYYFPLPTPTNLGVL